MDKAMIGKICVAILALLAAGTAVSQELQKEPRRAVVAFETAPDASKVTFGSNLFLEPCDDCNYSKAGGYFVWGVENCTSPGRTEWLAVPFIAAATGVPERISAPIILADPATCPPTR